jgi:TonB family protein
MVIMKYSIKFTLFLIFTLIFSVAIQAQKSEWVRIESENKEISFAIPDNFSFVFDKEGFSQTNPRNWSDIAEFTKVRAVTAYQNGATVFFDSYDVKNAKKALPLLLSNHRDVSAANISFETFSGLQIISEKDFYSAFYYFASEKNIYLIGVGARQKDNETIFKFLNSVKINNKTVFKIPVGKIDESDKILSIVNLVETPIEIEMMSKQERKELEKKSKKAKSDKTEPDPKPAADAKGLIVLVKPRASYTDIARQSQEQGVTILRATFRADGKIGKISVVKTLKYGLTEQAIRAFKRLRFIPAEKEITPIDVTKNIEYSFTIY